MRAPFVLVEKQTGEKRIGIYGGAFDPPHNAHVALAQVAVAHLELDELHIIPTGQAWHKSRPLSPQAHRLAMTRLAFDGLPCMLIDERELQRAGPTFTIDTLEAIQGENPLAQLYLIMGADQVTAFDKWHRWEAILDIAIICIAGRPQFSWFDAPFGTYKELKSRFLILPLSMMPVSATHIRQLLASSDHAKISKVGDLVPEAVARYIVSSELYSSR